MLFNALIWLLCLFDNIKIRKELSDNSDYMDINKKSRIFAEEDN